MGVTLEKGPRSILRDMTASRTFLVESREESVLPLPSFNLLN